MSNLRYVRTIDWDVPPTEFNELVTIQGTGSATPLERSSDAAFCNGDPLVECNAMQLHWVDHKTGEIGRRKLA